MKWEPMVDALDQRRRGRLVSFARVIAGPDLADDLVHDAIIATFSRSRSFTTAEQAETYVRRAIATRYIDLVRKDRARAARERLTAHYELVPGPGDYSPMSPHVAAALASLSPQVRACVVLRFLEDMSVSTTASVLNLAEGTVKRYVSEGLDVLNSRLGTREDVGALDVVDVGSAPRFQGGER